MQNPHQIRPDIGKLPKTTVDQIPLVLYIPPPPEGAGGAKGKNSSPIMMPPSIHSYPPKKAAPSIHKRRFAFLRRSKKSEGADNEKSDASAKEKGKKRRAINTEPKTWEDHWVPGDYPFVRLEGNRAACAICLMDFEEPERVYKDGKDKDAKAVAGDETEGAAAGDVQEVQVDEITQADAARLKLEDAGDGAQPLRLLPCGHVYHVRRFLLCCEGALLIIVSHRKHVWTHGSLTCLVVVPCVSVRSSFPIYRGKARKRGETTVGHRSLIN